MQIRVFTIPALHANEQSVEELNSFLRSHQIASVERQFVADGSNSYWSLYVTYVNGAPATSPASKKRVDYREVLSEQDFAVYAKLRTLRKTLADQENVPAYALFTNEHLAEMVRRQVDSKKALSEINGVGEARVEKYGEAFLAVLKQERAAASGNGMKTSDAET